MCRNSLISLNFTTFIYVSVSRTGSRLTFLGSGQVGVDSVDLRVPRGRAPKVLENAGRVGLDFI